MLLKQNNPFPFFLLKKHEFTHISRDFVAPDIRRLLFFLLFFCFIPPFRPILMVTVHKILNNNKSFFPIFNFLLGPFSRVVYGHRLIVFLLHLFRLFGYGVLKSSVGWLSLLSSKSLQNSSSILLLTLSRGIVGTIYGSERENHQ